MPDAHRDDEAARAARAARGVARRSSTSVAEASENRDEFDVAAALLGTPPTQQREALVLREWLGLSAIETASILESTPQGADALV